VWGLLPQKKKRVRKLAKCSLQAFTHERQTVVLCSKDLDKESGFCCERTILIQDRRMRVNLFVQAVIFPAFLLGGLALADVDFYDGGHHTVDYFIDDNINVDHGRPGVGTSVEIIQGGRITRDIRAFEDSRVLVDGGDIGSALENGIFAEDNSQVTFAAGFLRAPFFATDHAVTLISGGNIQYYVYAGEHSSVAITGGYIAKDLDTLGNSQAVVSGGDIQGYVMARFNSRVTISGGTCRGGYLAGVNDEPGTALITFEGTNFAIDGTSIGYGQRISDFAQPGTAWGFPCLTGTLTGRLTSGQYISKNIYIFGGSDMRVVPEPATILLLGFGAVALLRKRKT
jgi:hypothetical protein